MDVSKLSRLKGGNAGRLVVSPSATVRWAGGKILISAGGSKQAVATQDANLLQVLNAFAAPREPQEVENELGRLGRAFIFISIAALWQADVLIAADAHARASARDVGGETSEDESARSESEAAGALECVRSMASVVREIAGDLGGFGSYLHGSDDASPGTGPNIRARLEEIHRELSGIAVELSREREGYVASQLARSRMSRASTGIRLNLGSGASRLEGWVNVDLPPAELAMHLGWELPFADGSADYVYLSHVLEHLYYKEEAYGLLKEVRRVLAPSGIVRLVVPDIEKCIRAYVERDTEFFEVRKRYWPYAAACRTPLEHFLEYAGAGIRPGDFRGHKYGYDFETLALLLEEAGFGHVTRSDYMESAHPALRIDAAGKTAGYRCRDTFYSLFVEASG